MTAEQRILHWLERADFTGTGCRHSQDTIAAATGCTRRTVIRATQTLAAKGLITVSKERRPGCKWLCNVYRVHAWNPHKRSGVLNVLAAIRESRQAQCHTERTTLPSRAQAPTDLSFPQSQLHHKRLGSARVTGRTARRSLMCDCRECAEKNALLTDELSGALHTVRKLGAENSRLRGGGPHNAPDDPKTVNVWIILENWMWLCRGRKRNDRKPRLPVIDPGSKRWQIASRALKRESEGMIACIEAIEGLACRPYVIDTPPFRSASGRPSQRKDDIEYALKDETQVEKARMWRAETLGASEPALWHAYQAAEASAFLYGVLWSESHNRAWFNALPKWKQDAKRMRAAEEADAILAQVGARVIDLHSRRDVA
jgi:hypothetical protein